MRRWVISCLTCTFMFALLTGVALSVPCAAQASPSSSSGIAVLGTITGIAIDPTGAALSGVTVAAESPALSEKPRTVITGSEGQYAFESLPPGVYAISFSLVGFKPLLRDHIVLSASATVTVHAELALAARNDTVVVTARERAEDLQTVPQSIAAYSEENLASQSIQRLSDLGKVTPNFSYGQKVQSGSSAGQLYIRGIGQQDTNVQFSSGVGVYVDGVYLGRAQGNDLDMADVERVEVLYGPQGTLFGKNSDGGALNIVTKMPDITATIPTGPIELQTGGFGRIDLAGMWNIPLVANKAALQVAAAGWHQDGYSVRPLEGKDSANHNRASIRAKLLVRPTSTLQALLSVDGTIFNEHSGAYRLVDVRTTSAIPMLYASKTPYRYDNRWVTRSDFEYNGTGPNKNAGNVWGTSSTLTWEQPWGSLKSITAFRKLHVDSEFDPDGSPLTVLDVFNYVDQHQFSQELQASGSLFSKRLHWVSGIYYFREKAQDIQPVNIALEIFHGAANVSFNNFVVNQSPALYGQAVWGLARNFNLTVGGRLVEDLVASQRIQVGYPVPTVQQPLVSHSSNWTAFLPRIGLDYEWTPKLMTYISAAEGEKSGGYNGRASSIAEFTRFDPEKVWAYEAGLRSEWLDQRLRFNATGYYSDYRNFQIQINRSMTDPVTGLPVAFSYVGNMPKATVKGGEIAVTVVPTASLMLSAGLGVIDGRYVTISSGAPVTTQSQFVNAPKVTFTAGAEHSANLGRAGQFIGRIDYVYKTRTQYDYGNSPYVAQSPYGLLNARLSWQKPESRFSAFLFGTNVTHSHYAVGGLDDGAGGSLGEVVKLMGPPAEWGLGGQFRF